METEAVDSVALSAGKRLTGDEWTILCRHRPNVLVFAAGLDAGLVIQALAPVLRRPFSHGVPLAAGSSSAETGGTVIVDDVSALDEAERRQLLEWLSRPAAERVQVVSVTPVPLFPLVQRGTFLDALYYRLNAVYVVARD